MATTTTSRALKLVRLRAQITFDNMPWTAPSPIRQAAMAGA